MAELRYVRAQSQLGYVELVADFENGVYYMLVAPVAQPGEISEILRAARTLGLEDMDEDECPSELLDDGQCRVWFAQIGGALWP